MNNQRNYVVNNYESLNKPDISGDINIKDWFNQIKAPNKAIRGVISLARELGKYDENGAKNPIYDGLKSILPCVTYNFLFKDKKENKNIIGNTGLMFIDIDDSSFDIDILDKTKVFSYYHSLDNKGYHVIIKVNNLNIKNFKETYLSICNDLNILDFIDRNAIRGTQYAVTSFDENIFINDDCFIYDSLKDNSFSKKDIIEKEIKKVSKVLLKDEEEITTSDTFLTKNNNFIKLKFKKELDVYNEECVHIKEGELFYECYIPFSVVENKRLLIEGQKHTVLTCYINNLLCLNPTVSREQLIATIKSITTTTYSLRIPIDNLNAIIDNKLKQQREGTLTPIGCKLKYYWVNPLCENKRNSVGKKRNEETKLTIEEFFINGIKDINIKLNQEIISEIVGLSLSTIKRNLTKEMKEIIKTYNKNYNE